MTYATISLLLLLLLAAGATPLHAQNRIVAAPDAVELRKLWEREGVWRQDEEYGKRMWGGDGSDRRRGR